MKKYISDGTWFDKDTEVELISLYGKDIGLFFGIRTCENPDSEGNKNVGEKYKDEELCFLSEFEIIEK